VPAEGDYDVSQSPLKIRLVHTSKEIVVQTPVGFPPGFVFVVLDSTFIGDIDERSSRTQLL
jgi:hypothetical protein